MRVLVITDWQISKSANSKSTNRQNNGSQFLGRGEMTYEGWEQGMPGVIKADPVWGSQGDVLV